ncbi:MAG: hypothetical protein A2Y38_05930 [Spirochaetes bacterium GWB1_59_5]|nr:MAG: hypothetical protein A2Y38_05930 [Spirochaetes bacterium GWB1_59_5]
MAEMKNSIASLRLRIPEALYQKTLSMLSETGKGNFLSGSCGWTRIEGLQGGEVVTCVHTLADKAMGYGQTSTDDLTPGTSIQKQERGSWPIVFYLMTDSDGRKENSLVQRSLAYGFAPILEVGVRPDGEMSGTFFSEGSLIPIDSILIPGSDILFWVRAAVDTAIVDADQNKRFEQSFGGKTRRLMSLLRIGVVGVSGTGSPVSEMLYRLGIGELVLVDDDCIETKNLGRIYNSSTLDAQEGRLKVDVMGDAFARNGLPTRVRRIAGTTNERRVVAELAQCDILFGCMDTHSGRALLNRLATFYLIPYFDLGVNLRADGQGGITGICGAVHYLKPGGSSLLGRRAITLDNIAAEDLKRTNPDMYRQQKEEKYITGVVEEQPAVITVNTMIASLALNDFLARLHPYRRITNSEIGCIRVDLREPLIHCEEDGPIDVGLARWVGRGDVEPFLNMPMLAK